MFNSVGTTAFAVGFNFWSTLRTYLIKSKTVAKPFHLILMTMYQWQKIPKWYCPSFKKGTEILIRLYTWYQNIKYPFHQSSSVVISNEHRTVATNTKERKNMKLFSLIRKNFDILGICLDQSNHRFNTKIFFISFSYGLTCVSYFLFLFYEANTFWEYTNNIYATSTAILIVTCFLIIIYQITNVFELIENCENFVNKSESQTSNAIYDKTNRQLEKWSKIIYLAVAEITPMCLVLPQCIVSLIDYSTTDSGNDAFELQLPMW